MTKLKTLLERFPKTHLLNKEITPEEKEQYFAILRSYLANVLPSNLTFGKEDASVINYLQSNNDVLIANIKRDDARYNHVYSKEYLPFHLNDTKWMVKYFMSTIKADVKQDKHINKAVLCTYKQQQKNMQLVQDKPDEIYNDFVLVDRKAHTKIPSQVVREFIETDKDYAAAREAVEIDLTRAQINYMMEHNEPNEVLLHHQYERTDVHSVSVSYHPGLGRISRNTDKMFEAAVVDGMTRLGLNEHSVQKALVKYAPLWREQTMNSAFYNEYAVEPSQMQKLGYNDWYLNCIHENFRGLWLRNREYEYGQSHRAILKEMNAMTPNMQLHDSELLRLKEKVHVLDARYRSIVEIARNQKQHFETDNQKL